MESYILSGGAGPDWVPPHARGQTFTAGFCCGRVGGSPARAGLDLISVPVHRQSPSPWPAPNQLPRSRLQNGIISNKCSTPPASPSHAGALRKCRKCKSNGTRILARPAQCIAG